MKAQEAVHLPPAPSAGVADPLAALWNYLLSWVSRDGGVYGPVVHRWDYKRMFSIHDTPWTQQAVIEGLLHLYRRSGHDYWLNWALRLADAQCARLEADGRFRWAGHEDDRFSSLVHNVLADCALLDTADLLRDRGDQNRRDRYLNVAEKNLQEYVIGKLYRPELHGFVMNPIDYYSGRDRFIVNMNSVAIEALIKLDRQRGTEKYSKLVCAVGRRIQSLQSHDGPSKGGLPYSDLEPDVHVPLYTGIALRGLPGLAQLTGDKAWADLARGAVSFLDNAQNEDTGLWHHKIQRGQVRRYPIFVAGAGMICSGILDAAQLTGADIDVAALADRLLLHQYPNGAIRNFIGYDHPDNGRGRGSGVPCWEDVYPTPNWNAQAFHFLCRVLPPPEPILRPHVQFTFTSSRRYVYAESNRISIVIGTWPPNQAIVAIFVKHLRFGLLVPGKAMLMRAIRKWVTRLPRGRAAR